MDASLDGQIARLKNLPLEKLRDEWRNALEADPPPCRSADTLRWILAWRLQEAALCGLSPATKSRLRKLARTLEQCPGQPLTPPPRPKPGTVLVREWKGVLHRVQVLREGFEHEGERYASLSEVARRITGTRWSGPLFFGLKNGGRPPVYITHAPYSEKLIGQD